MQFCKHMVSSLGSFLLLGSLFAPGCQAESTQVSGRTDLVTLMDAARLHMSARNLAFAKNMSSEAIEQSSTTNDDAALAANANDLALLNVLEDQLDSADGYCRMSLQKREKIFGVTDPSIAESLNTKALIALARKDYKTAEQSVNAALLVENKDATKNALRIADSFDILARTYLDQGQFNKAEAPAIKSWRIREDALGVNHPVVAQSLYTRGLYYAQKGDVDNSLDCLKRSLNNGDQLQKATSQMALAVVYAVQGNFELSREQYNEAIKLKAAQLGEDHPLVIAQRAQYIKTLWNHQKWIDAIQLRRDLPSVKTAPAAGLEERLIQRSFQTMDLPQKVEFKNLVICLALTVLPLVLMGTMLCAQQLMSLPNGAGLLEFLNATRREDIQQNIRQQKPNVSSTSLKPLTPSSSSKATNPSGKLQLKAQREHKPNWHK